MGEHALKLLFTIYFKNAGTSKGLKLTVPRARWPRTLETPKEKWVGLYALPVPKNTTALPEFELEPDLEMPLAIWEYGDVAEILHVGPYDKEIPTVNKLKEFINNQDYEIAGGHEEEYIKGPVMLGRHNSDEKHTIQTQITLSKSAQVRLTQALESPLLVK